MDEKAERYEQLSAYLDGELSEEQRQEVERLLEQDAEARRLLAELRETARLVAGLPRAKASSEQTAAIMDRLERRELLADLYQPAQPARSPRRFEWMRPLGLAAGLVIITTASWFLHTRTQTAVRKQAAPTPDVADQDAVVAAAAESKAEPRGGEVVAARRPEKPKGLVPYTPAKRGPEKTTVEAIVAAQSAEAKGLKPPVRQYEGDGEEGTEHATARDESAPGVAEASEVDPASAEAGVLAEETATSRPGGKLDDLLLANALDAGQIVDAGFAEFSNRIVLHTDQYTTQEIMARVRHFMASTEIPDLRAGPSREPVSATQPFYAMNTEEVSTDDALTLAEAAGWEPIRVVTNLPVGEAARLVESLQQVTRRRQSARWTANDQPLSGKESVDELAAMFLMFSAGDEGAGGSGRQIAAPDGTGPGRGGEVRFGDVGAKSGSGPKAGQRATRGLPAGSAATTSPATQPATRDDALVTLAILLTPAPPTPPPSVDAHTGEVAPTSSPAASEQTDPPSEDTDDRRP